jgi:filamentous hemagglutinin family protein
MRTITTLLFCFSLLVQSSVYAEVVTDGSLGAAVDLSGQMVIPQNLGTTANNNLFHSFSKFNVNTDESATFTGDSSLKNVISRVTGGQVSTIDGLLKSNVGTANFYFVNPAGVTFGSNATVDVPAAFHVSTANSVHFSDGSEFNTSNTSVNTLSVAEPTGFGFLNNQAGNIAIKDSQLNFAQGSAVSLTANNISLDNGYLSSSAGNIQMLATGGIATNVQHTTPSSQALAGRVEINNGSLLDTSGQLGGNITIQAGDVTVDNGSWVASDTNTSGSGNSGTISITSNRVSVLNAGQISSNTYDTGNAGTIDINAAELVLDGQGIGASIVSNAENNGIVNAGNAGAISVKANKLSVLNGGQIGSNTFGSGNAGSIGIDAHDILVDGAGIDTWISTAALDTGNAGTVTINSDRLTVLNGGKVSSSTWWTGQAGTVSITANDLKVSNGGWISNDTVGSGNAGAITIESIDTELNGGYISSDTYSTGHAGSVTVNSRHLNVLNSGSISSNTYDDTGNAGDIFVTADKVSLSKSGHISSDNTDGKGGDINFNVQQLTLKEGGVISTTTRGLGNAGTIVVQNATNVVIDGVDEQATLTRANGNTVIGQHSGFYLNTQGAGNGGNLRLNSQGLSVSDGGIISAVAVDSDGEVKNTASTSAGSLLINADTINLTGGGLIATSTSSAANAGSIIINAKDSLNISGQFDRILHSGISNVRVSDESGILSNASYLLNPNATQLGEGGNINLNTNVLALSNGGLVSVSTEGDKQAGNIDITAKQITLNNATIKATAERGSTGMAGSVTVTATKALRETNNASINSSTFGSGKAGDVNIKTPMLALESSADISALAGSGSSGATGVLNIEANTVNLSNGGKISVQNDGIAANPSTIKPSDLVLDIPYLNLQGGIITAATSGNVNAGNVIVKTQHPLALRAGASINSNTTGSGSAGNVTVMAPTITLDNSSISAAASQQSQGQTGNVKVTAGLGVYLTNNANISLKNEANSKNPRAIVPSSVSVSAPDIDLKNSSITTEATGNVDAGNININSSHWLTLDPSFITTTANTGNGGDITIKGGQLIKLQDSGFLTSVSGANSNGGNINVEADYLIMNTGVIQANAVGGAGGDITLKLNALIPSQNRVILGGKKVAWSPYQTGANVIQAASENGVSGAINVTSPQFDISASISGLDSSQLIRPSIDNTLCQNSAMLDSSLSRSGQGGIPIDESRYGFIPPANSVTNTDQHPEQHVNMPSGAAFPCATSQP